MDTPHGKRNCFEATVERAGRKPLIARFGGIPLHRQNEGGHRSTSLAVPARRQAQGTGHPAPRGPVRMVRAQRSGHGNPPGPQARRSHQAGTAGAACVGRTHGQAAEEDAHRLPSLPRGHPRGPGNRRPTRNDHWRAGCEETRKPCSGRDRRKRTRPRCGGERRAGRGNPPGAIPAGRPGPTQPAASTSRCCIPSCGASTSIWCAGPAGSTNGCADAKDEQRNSWPAPPSATRDCSLTGDSASNPMAGRWEPCKPRGFRTVLRAAGGEIPPADSPRRSLRHRGTGPETAGRDRRAARDLGS